MLVKFPVKDVSLSHSRQVGNFKLSLNTGTLYWVTILILKKPFGLTIDFFSHLSHVTSNLVRGWFFRTGWYLAGFFEQVKSRDFLTLTIQNRHEEDQIHRSPDHWDLERTGIRPESV